MAEVVVIGQGYVGLPMALAAAAVGHHVVGLDADAAVVEQLNAGRSHIGDVSDEVLGAELAAGRYRATTDESCLDAAEIVLVCVPTPLAADGGPDLGPVEAAADAIGRHAHPGLLAVLESTTYPGTTEEVFAPRVWGERFDADSVAVAFSPERINPGDEWNTVKNTPKVVGGLTPAATQRAAAFYASFVTSVVPAKRAREAEMSKLLENTFRHVNIALVNEMVRFCDDLDIDLWNAIDCAETKPFGFMAFRPGPGVGGHCIPVDPSYLSHRVRAKLGYVFRMVELAEEINHAAPHYVAERVRRGLNDRRLAVRGSRIVLLGVTYKADVADLRETPAEPLADILLAEGADLRYYDPYTPVWRRHAAGGSWTELTSAPDLVQALDGADYAVLLQAHSRFDLPALLAAGVPVLDTRGRLPEQANIQRL